MKLVFNGATGPYVFNTETGKISDPPKKCYYCNIKQKNKGCSLEDCKEQDNV